MLVNHLRHIPFSLLIYVSFNLVKKPRPATKRETQNQSRIAIDSKKREKEAAEEEDCHLLFDAVCCRR